MGERESAVERMTMSALPGVIAIPEGFMQIG
jgi:hypothetical protein